MARRSRDGGSCDGGSRSGCHRDFTLWCPPDSLYLWGNLLIALRFMIKIMKGKLRLVFLNGWRCHYGDGHLIGGDGIHHRRSYAGLNHRSAVIAVQGRQNPVVDGGEDLTFAVKLHLGFGRMDVDVHGAGAESQVNGTAGELAHHFLIAIGLLQGGHHGAGLHISAVHKEVLVAATATTASGQGGEPLHRHILPTATDRHKAQGEIATQHGVEGGFQTAIPWCLHLLLAVTDEADSDFRVGEGGTLDGGEDRRTLGGIFFDKFQPSRCVIK